MNILVKSNSMWYSLPVSSQTNVQELYQLVAELFHIPIKGFFLKTIGGTVLCCDNSPDLESVVSLDGIHIIDTTANSTDTISDEFVSSTTTTVATVETIQEDLTMLELCVRLCGGIDFQNREGSKIGSGGVLSESQAALERKERLRKLALETIDITKDPYFMRNHLGTFECKLCLTLHPNEGNYLAHTQGKRHQSNLGRRAAMEARNAAPKPIVSKEVLKKNIIRIGRPGYKV